MPDMIRIRGRFEKQHPELLAIYGSPESETSVLSNIEDAEEVIQSCCGHEFLHWLKEACCTRAADNDEICQENHAALTHICQIAVGALMERAVEVKNRQKFTKKYKEELTEMLENTSRQLETAIRTYGYQEEI